jgi:hypothetical protein
MDLLVELLQRLLHAGLQLLLNPFYYIGILFIILQYRMQIQLERKLFHTRLHSLIDETWRTLLWGWIGGLIASVVLMFIGISLQTDVIAVVWAISLIMIMLRVRFLCLAYAIGVLGVMHIVLMFIPQAADLDNVGWIFQMIVDADVPSLLVIVAILHLLEGLLSSMQGARMASPLFLEAKRGKIIGGYQLQGFWPVPLFLLVPMQGGSTEGIPWGTLFGANFSGGWSLLAFPAMIGFVELTVSRLPRDKVAWSSKMLFLYGIVIMVLAIAAHFWSPFVIVAVLCTIGLHEALIWYSQWNESKRSALYTHTQRGLMILAVVPGSPAAELGIQAGEIIHKINGYKTIRKADLHHAMQLNSAFCKMEIVNLQGEIKFLQRALFSGEHHQLGLILAPDQQAMYFVANKPMHVFAYLRNKLSGLLSNESGRPM